MLVRIERERAIARSVLDAALLLDATTTVPVRREFADAAQREPGRLRIALSTKILRRFGPGRQAEVARVSGRWLLRELGHEVINATPTIRRPLRNYLPRYLRGISDDADALATRIVSKSAPRHRADGFVLLGADGGPASREAALNNGSSRFSTTSTSSHSGTANVRPDRRLPAPGAVSTLLW
ncbi:6-aminohexanoate-cyclic-dimer hydrolase domain protein [Mycobacterium ulcerans str. Harvey]|uniref:6-aminohexanoate-cyclic-dimer hydrolase domain protein n=1 Tax=Mycobacterium ulcerans str. Harvey TaxID=1299332 RepID=A0ABN0R928_MYCUL|nr:6-aminohexanoate-cyclic-dimer hydrolase domain protein [Mycobacterium ulcerans str. Harvey]